MDLEEIERQLENFDESLFNITGALRSAVTHFSNNSEIERARGSQKNLFEVTAKLIAGDVESTAKAVVLAVMTMPKNIHAWCNKAMYHILKQEAYLAREAADRVETLRKVHLPIQEAKIDYAQWLAMLGKEDKASMLRAIEIIENVIFDEENRAEENLQIAFFKASEFLTTILLKYSYSIGIYEKKPMSWYEGKVVKVIGRLVEVQKSINLKKTYQVYLLLAQLETFFRSLYKTNKIRDSQMDVFEEFSKQGGIEGLNFQSCVDRLYDGWKIPNNSKFGPDTARFLLHFAFGKHNPKEVRVEYSKKALEVCQASFEKGELNGKVIEIASDAEFCLWALDHYEANKDQVRQEFKELKGSNLFEGAVDGFICMDAYFVRDTENTERRSRLERVHEFIQQQQDICKSEAKAAKLARVKYILGRSDEEVRETFEQALAKPNLFMKHHVHPLILYGRFLEKIGCRDEALDKYKKAISVASGVEDSWKTWLAKRRVKVIQQQMRNNDE